MTSHYSAKSNVFYLTVNVYCFRTNDVSTNFYFTNVSAVDVRIEFSFLAENAASDLAFGFKPNYLQISVRTLQY